METQEDTNKQQDEGTIIANVIGMTLDVVFYIPRLIMGFIKGL